MHFLMADLFVELRWVQMNIFELHAVKFALTSFTDILWGKRMGVQMTICPPCMPSINYEVQRLRGCVWRSLQFGMWLQVLVSSPRLFIWWVSWTLLLTTYAESILPILSIDSAQITSGSFQVIGYPFATFKMRKAPQLTAFFGDTFQIPQSRTLFYLSLTFLSWVGSSTSDQWQYSPGSDVAPVMHYHFSLFLYLPPLIASYWLATLVP